MVTADEIGRVKVFAGLDAGTRERVARMAADISLAPGEYAANQGDERSLFGVLEGRIEAVNEVDGIERVVGERRPGDVIGEVPIVLGAPFPVGFRAVESSRVMRIEARDYHAIAVDAPEVAKEIGMLAAHRIGGERGLEAIAADPPADRAIVVGQRWDTARAAALPRPQQRQVRVAHARRTGCGGPVGRRAAAARGAARDARR
jgi:thioredoxin reductase (NADPH)